MGLIEVPVNPAKGADGLTIIAQPKVVADANGEEEVFVTVAVGEHADDDGDKPFNTIQFVDSNGDIIPALPYSGNSGSNMTNLTKVVFPPFY